MAPKKRKDVRVKQKGAATENDTVPRFPENMLTWISYIGGMLHDTEKHGET